MLEPIPYGRQSINSDDIEAVVEVLRSDFLTTGPAVDLFERGIESIIGVPAAAVSSGTAALHCAYAAIGLQPGDEVITSPLTFVATAAAAVHLGAVVRFADVSDDTLTISPESVEPLITPRTRVIIPVDFAGHPSDMTGLVRLARAHELKIITDGCHSFGAKIGDHPVGAFGDATAFSFHPVKTVTTAEGGAVVTNNADIMRRVKLFRNHGLVAHVDDLGSDDGPWHREVHEIGLNYRLSDLHAALGTAQLRRLGSFLSQRRSIAQRYTDLLSDVVGIELPQQRDGFTSSWHLYPIRVRSRPRREVYQQLHIRGIRCQVHYLPVYRHPFFARLGPPVGPCPVAEGAYSEMLSLPIYPDLSLSDQDRVVAAVHEVMSI